jgi:hypothetical protein
VEIEDQINRMAVEILADADHPECLRPGYSGA